MDLDTVVGMATLVAVVTGFAIGIAQVRESNRQRRDGMAVNLLQSFRTPEGERAMLTVIDLPEQLTAEQLRARGPELDAVVNKWCMECEALGYMVYRRSLPLHTVDEMFGGVLRSSWRKLRPWLEEKRRASGNKVHFEWFQWLAERLEQYPAPGKLEGAYVAHRDWRP